MAAAKVLALVSVIVLSACLANAAPIEATLSQQIAGNKWADPTYYEFAAINEAGGYQVGDKLFTNFSLTVTSGNTGNPPTPSAIGVKAVKVDWDNTGQWEYGLLFTGPWSVVAPALVDIVIQFKVTVTDQTSWIVDNTLAMEGAAAGDGLAGVHEKVEDSAGNLLTDPLKYVWAQSGATHLRDHREFGGMYQELWISKDVQVNGGLTGNASLSLVYQTFSQVPEPATMGLLGLGGLLVALRRRRRAL